VMQAASYISMYNYMMKKERSMVSLTSKETAGKKTSNAVALKSHSWSDWQWSADHQIWYCARRKGPGDAWEYNYHPGQTQAVATKEKAKDKLKFRYIPLTIETSPAYDKICYSIEPTYSYRRPSMSAGSGGAYSLSTDDEMTTQPEITAYSSFKRPKTETAEVTVEATPKAQKVESKSKLRTPKKKPEKVGKVKNLKKEKKEKLRAKKAAKSKEAKK